MKFNPIILITEKGKKLKISPKGIKSIEFDFINPIIILKTGKKIELNKDDYDYRDWMYFINHIRTLFNI